MTFWTIGPYQEHYSTCILKQSKDTDDIYAERLTGSFIPGLQKVFVRTEDSFQYQVVDMWEQLLVLRLVSVRTNVGDGNFGSLGQSASASRSLSIAPQD